MAARNQAIVELLAKIAPSKADRVKELLAQDPRTTARSWPAELSPFAVIDPDGRPYPREAGRFSRAVSDADVRRLEAKGFVRVEDERVRMHDVPGGVLMWRHPELQARADAERKRRVDARRNRKRDVERRQAQIGSGIGTVETSRTDYPVTVREEP